NSAATMRARGKVHSNGAPMPMPSSSAGWRAIIRPTTISATKKRPDRVTLPLLPTSLVGSYAQPDWLIDRAKLAGRFPPRTRQKELWRIPEEFIDQAWDDATVWARHVHERAGLNIITEREMRRDNNSNSFANALDGVDMENHGTSMYLNSDHVYEPLVVDMNSGLHAVQERDVVFLKAHVNPVKATK